MIDPQIQQSITAALQAYSAYEPISSEPIIDALTEVFAADEDFLDKVNALDAVFDEYPQVASLREVFFDLLMINFFNADVNRLEENYLDTPEWEEIEEETLDRGTELLNLLLYLNECKDEEIEPSLEDYLQEFLLVDEDEFQDEHQIYEPLIANQILVESSPEEVKNVALRLSDDSEMKELFYPTMAFFQHTEPTDAETDAVAKNAVDPAFDMAVFSILTTFNNE